MGQEGLHNLHVAATATVTDDPIRDKLYELHTEIGPKYYEELLGAPRAR